METKYPELQSIYFLLVFRGWSLVEQLVYHRHGHILHCGHHQIEMSGHRRLSGFTLHIINPMSIDPIMQLLSHFPKILMATLPAFNQIIGIMGYAGGRSFHFKLFTSRMAGEHICGQKCRTRLTSCQSTAEVSWYS